MSTHAFAKSFEIPLLSPLLPHLFCTVVPILDRTLARRMGNWMSCSPQDEYLDEIYGVQPGFNSPRAATSRRYRLICTSTVDLGGVKNGIS